MAKRCYEGFFFSFFVWKIPQISGINRHPLQIKMRAGRLSVNMQTFFEPVAYRQTTTAGFCNDLASSKQNSYPVSITVEEQNVGEDGE